MCQTLEAWLDEHPGIPAKPRGESHHISLYVSREEAEAMSKLLIDHRLFGIHGGKISDLVRHGLSFYVPELLTLMDEGYRPLAELMRADIERSGIGQTVGQIKDYYDTKGLELRMLLDVGEVDKALEHYEAVVGFVKARDGVWAALLMRMLREHPELAAFRDAVRRMGAVEEARLRHIEED